MIDELSACGIRPIIIRNRCHPRMYLFLAADLVKEVARLVVPAFEQWRCATGQKCNRNGAQGL